MSITITLDEINTDYVAKLKIGFAAKFFIFFLKEHQGISFKTQAELLKASGICKKTFQDIKKDLEVLKLDFLFKGLENSPHDHDLNNIYINKIKDHDHVQGEKIAEVIQIDSHKEYQQLKEWKYPDLQVIERYGLEKVKLAIELTKKYKAKFPGAYFAGLIKKDLNPEQIKDKPKQKVRGEGKPEKSFDPAKVGSVLDQTREQAIDFLIPFVSSSALKSKLFLPKNQELMKIHGITLEELENYTREVS